MSNPRKRIVIIGATSTIAEHCARIWAHRAPSDFVLVARDKDRAESIAADLQVRGPGSTFEVLQADFIEPVAIDNLAEQIASGGTIDIVLIAHGSLPDQQRCQNELALCYETLIVNGISPALLAEAFVRRMRQADAGTIAVIGSVAGDRGRKSNYVYGAAKGLVDRYMQGLQHRLAATGVRAVLIKPGPTDTPMTAEMKQQGTKLADAANVAKRIVAGIDRGKPVVYAPPVWLLIMLVVRHLPKFIFNRIDI